MCISMGFSNCHLQAQTALTYSIVINRIFSLSDTRMNY